MMNDTKLPNSILPQIVADDVDDEAFFTMLAHELRSPLSALSSGIRLLGMAPEPEERDWAIDMLGNQVRHMTGLVDNLLEFVRVGNGNAPLDRAPADFVELVTRVVSRLEDTLRSRNQQALVHGKALGIPGAGEAAPAVTLDVDAKRLEQAIDALATDVLRSLPERAVVTLGIEVHGAEAVLCIEPSDTPNVADPHQEFCSEPAAQKLPPSAYHIGVLLAFAIIVRQGGKLEGTRLAGGRGTRYVVRFPFP